MKIYAHAKLNLFLNVLDKFPDGYHNIYTGVTFIDLYDEVNILPSKKTSIDYEGEFAPKKGTFENDIILKTLKIIFKNDNRNKDFEINIKKNIPYGAGLGGGSANSAAIIIALKKLKLIKENINLDEIISIGSDVPMCLYSKNCLVQGRGELIKSLYNIPKLFFVLIKPNFSISTKEIFLNYTFERKKNLNDIVKNFKLNHNDLEKVAKKLYPEINNILEILSSFKKSEFFRMTGSGSCCYLAFKKLSNAQEALQILKKQFPDFWTYLAKNYY